MYNQKEFYTAFDSAFLTGFIKAYWIVIVRRPRITPITKIKKILAYSNISGIFAFIRATK